MLSPRMRRFAWVLPARLAGRRGLLARAGDPGLCPSPTQIGFEAAPTRGIILISIDSLRADHLSVYGYPKATTPIPRGTRPTGDVFEHAFAQMPSTLPSHMSMFTGLYPAEHGVFPPSSVLAAEIPTLPEILLQAGFRTAGHTEGGYVQGGYGFARGFGEWTDLQYTADTDVERTFARGVAVPRELGAGRALLPLSPHLLGARSLRAAGALSPDVLAGRAAAGRRSADRPAFRGGQQRRRETARRRSSTTRRSTTPPSATSTTSFGVLRRARTARPWRTRPR